MGRLSFLLVLLTVCGPIGAADIARGKVTALAQVNSPSDRHWDYFKAKIDETPDVEMEYFIRGEVGTEEMMLTALRRNRVQIGGITMWGLSGLVFFYYSLSDFATHVTETHQSYDKGIQVANKQWWDSLAETQRVTIANAFFPIGRARADIRGLIKTLRSDLVTRGITLHALTDQQRALLIAETAPSHRIILDEIGGRAEGAYAAIVEGRRAFAAQSAAPK